MELIERYVASVLKQIPKAKRAQAQQRLRADITKKLQALPDEFGDETQRVSIVLEQFGDPQIVALDYGATARMLIGPTYFPKYVTVLKFVSLAIVIGVTVLTLLRIISTSEQTWWQVASFYLSTIWQIWFQGIAWVTLIFAILAYYQVDFRADSPFRVQELKELPASKLKINRGEAIFTLIVTVLFFSLLYLNPQLSYTTNDVSFNLSLFDPEVFAQTNWLLIIAVILSLVQEGCKLVWGQWTFPRASIHALLISVSTGLTALFLANSALYPADSIAIFEKFTTLQAESGIQGLIFFIIMISLFELAVPFYHLLRDQRTKA